MKKALSILLALCVLLASVLALAGCGKKETLTIAVPNDTTNEARALILLQENGIIKLSADAGITATINDIIENPLNITFKEVEAAQIPSVLPDVDYAVINSNYAIAAGMKPAEQSLLIEGAYSAYSNIVAVKSGNESNDNIKAPLQSKSTFFLCKDVIVFSDFFALHESRQVFPFPKSHSCGILP